MKSKVTISRPSFSSGKEIISLTVKDVSSKIRFLELEIKLDDFAKILTGLSEVECDMKIRGLEFVGKKKEMKNFEFLVGVQEYSNRKESAFSIAKGLVQSGWFVREYFDSKGSFFIKDGEDWARTIIYRYVSDGE